MQDGKGVATTAKLGGHPIHPMLIPFPIAFLISTFASDLGMHPEEPAGIDPAIRRRS